MAHIVADRIRESATVTGQGNFTLSGAVTNFEAFADVMANSDTCWYCAVQASGGWEVGLGTKASGVLQRTTVLQSSNADAKTNFYAGGSGTVDVFMVDPAINSFHGGTATKSTPIVADSISLWDSVANAVKRVTLTDFIATFKASASAIWAGTSDVLWVTAKNIADASARVVLTSGTTIATDASLGRIFYVVLGHNATFSAPTNLIDGVTYTWIIKQDATGSRTGAFNSIFRFPSAPTLSTAAGSVDIVSGVYNSTDTKIEARFSKGS